MIQIQIKMCGFLRLLLGMFNTSRTKKVILYYFISDLCDQPNSRHDNYWWCWQLHTMQMRTWLLQNSQRLLECKNLSVSISRDVFVWRTMCLHQCLCFSFLIRLFQFIPYPTVSANAFIPYRTDSVWEFRLLILLFPPVCVSIPTCQWYWVLSSPPHSLHFTVLR
jgi:hypothetical protein